ncbi:MAG: hypothetical protein U0168_02115 [Nannocystaceae bacterium]
MPVASVAASTVTRRRRAPSSRSSRCSSASTEGSDRRPGLEPTEDHVDQRRGHVAGVLGQLQLAGTHGRRECLVAVAGKRSTAEQRLEQRDAERELIGRGPHRQALELLGRHVGRRAHHARRHRGAGPSAPACGRAHALARRLTRVGQAEVRDARPTLLADEHVVGLEVAVHQARGVGRRETAADLHEHRDDLGPRPTRVQPRAQGPAADQLHRQEHAPGVEPDVVDRHDVGVVDRRGGTGLLLEPSPCLLGIGEAIVVDQLDRDLAIEPRIPGREDRTHAAATQLADQGEATDARRCR